MNTKVFGKLPQGERLTRIKRSPNYSNGQFQNISPTQPIPDKASYFKIWLEFLRRPKSVIPPKPLPSVITDLNRLPLEPTVTWFGHSSYLISARGYNILVDPVFSGHASPFASVTKAFAGSNVYQAGHMPHIHLLLITHDHYDHLDFDTVMRLAPLADNIVAPLGVAQHLEYWGIDTKKIQELDWWESTGLVTDVNITATPARHFSGRTLIRNRSLWCSYVLNFYGTRIFIGGDSGYDDQFAAIGKKFGPFDLALLECGQYGKHWPLIHMLPEQTAKAAFDLGAKVLMPLHWGKFNLSTHSWNEPVKRVVAESVRVGLPIVTPMIGEPYRLGTQPRPGSWWHEL